MGKVSISPAARRALNCFEEAVRAHEMKGAMHPSDHEAIEYEYTRAKQALEKLLSKEKSNV